jgi:hypothetical protein
MVRSLATAVTVDDRISIDPYSISDHRGNSLIDDEGNPLGYLSCSEFHHAKIAQAIYLNAWRLEPSQFKRIKEWIDLYDKMAGKLTDPKY